MNVGPYGQYQAQFPPDGANPPALITFTVPVAGNPNTLGTTTTIFPALAVDTVGDVLYITTNGSTWVAISGGGGGSAAVYAGSGSPQGVVTAIVGSTYLDTATGSLWAKQTGSGSTGWLQLIA